MSQLSLLKCKLFMRRGAPDLKQPTVDIDELQFTMCIKSDWIAQAVRSTMCNYVQHELTFSFCKLMWHAADDARTRDLESATCAVMQATACTQSVREQLVELCKHENTKFCTCARWHPSAGLVEHC